MRRLQSEVPATNRRGGFVPMEMVLSLSVTFTFAMVMFLMGREACYRLFQFIATMVGSPI